jgi:hypothetical protein
MAWVGVPIAVIWLLVAWALGREHERRRTALSTQPNDATPPSSDANQPVRVIS